MIDDMLFQRGHIMTRIDNVDVDDYDTVIPDHYFENVLGLKGEVIDSNGSEYKLVSLNKDDFVIEFSVYGNDFEAGDGTVTSFEELVVKCTGKIVEEDDYDILQINTYNVVDVK